MSPYMRYLTLQDAMNGQRNIQIQFHGGDAHPADVLTGAERADYVRTMTLAAVAELFEALDESKWKTWAAGQGEINRDGMLSEIVDAMQFVFNLLEVVGASAEDVLNAMAKKHVINLQRIDNGTNGMNKCTICKRALDDDYVTCTATMCNAELNRPVWHS